MNTWVDLVYHFANYRSWSYAMVWMVTAANMVTAGYMPIGGESPAAPAAIALSLTLDGTSVSGPLEPTLQFNLKGATGFSAARKVETQGFALDNGVPTAIRVFVDPALSEGFQVYFQRNDGAPWSTSDGNTYIRAQITIPVR